MGVPVLPESIDYEIRDIIETLNNFSFIQTKASCSGYTGPDGISDGTNSEWIGQPYILMESLDDVVCLSDFLPFIMSRMIFDPLATDANDKIQDYENKLNSVNIPYDGNQLCHIFLEYRNNKVCISIQLRENNRTQEYIEKIWDFFRLVLTEYINRE